jgi:hypothetical protein
VALEVVPFVAKSLFLAMRRHGSVDDYDRQGNPLINLLLLLQAALQIGWHQPM